MKESPPNNNCIIPIIIDVFEKGSISMVRLAYTNKIFPKTFVTYLYIKFELCQYT